MIETLKEALRTEPRENVLDMITTIEITTMNSETYNACIKIRNQLVPDNYSKRNPLRWDVLQSEDEQVREEDCDSERQESINGATRENENKAVLEVTE